MPLIKCYYDCENFMKQENHVKNSAQIKAVLLHDGKSWYGIPENLKTNLYSSHIIMFKN